MTEELHKQERAKLHKQERDVRLKIQSLLSKNHKHLCLYPNCNKPSIQSHSISRSCLSLIAEDSHVITPVSNLADVGTIEDILKGEKINLKLKEIGIASKDASTFKGFCGKHDKSIFENIDDRGVVTQRDLFLQLYRTANKYMFFYNKVIKESELTISGDEYYSNTNFDEKIDVNLEKIIFLLDDILTDSPELDDVNLTYYETLTPWSEKIDLDVVVLYKKINFYLPVALQNNVVSHNKKIFSQTLIVVIPNKDKKSTSIIILCHKRFKNDFLNLLNSNISVLNLIESLIINDSEFYITPSIINSFDKNKRDTIEKDFYFSCYEGNFLKEYDISIFDDIRKKLCCELSEKEIVHELKKIYNTPVRDSTKDRNHKMRLQAIKNRYEKIDIVKN